MSKIYNTLGRKKKKKRRRRRRRRRKRESLHNRGACGCE